jgi:hypothetical protein
VAHDTGLPPDRQALIQPALDRAEKFRALYRVVLGLSIAAVLALTGINAVQGNQTLHAIRAQQQANAPKVDEALVAARAARRGVAILEDCLTPGGKCYERSQANQADVLDIVTQRFIYVMACSQNTATQTSVTALTRCVANLEAKAGP